MTPSWVRMTDPSGKQSNFLILPFSSSNVYARCVHPLARGGKSSERRLESPGMGSPKREPDEDPVTHRPQVVELTVHVSKRRPVVPDGIVPLARSAIRDTH
jgi:hypothetical protein